jgi:hypothetical protein
MDAGEGFMLIISAGMQKSGSAYFYNVINELLARSCDGMDARQIKQDRKLDDLMAWHNNNIGRMSLGKLIRLWRISHQAGAFVVKTHQGPTLSSRILSKLGMIRIVYCFRDPRDVLLSAVDHGQQILENGKQHTFARMLDFDKALQHVIDWLRIWKNYASMSGVLTVKYEDMMFDPVGVTKKIEEFLGLRVNSEIRNTILWQFARDNPEGNRKGMHFNQARVHRYKTELTEEQKSRCDAAFKDYLRIMGYHAD